MYELKLPDATSASGLIQEKEAFQYIHAVIPETHRA